MASFPATFLPSWQSDDKRNIFLPNGLRSVIPPLSRSRRQGIAVLYSEEREKRETWGSRTVYLLIRSSLSSLSISSSIAACKSPILLKASLRSACRLWFAASKLSMSISYRYSITWILAHVQSTTSMISTALCTYHYCTGTETLQKCKQQWASHQLVLFPAGFSLLFSQFAHLLLEVTDLTL